MIMDALDEAVLKRAIDEPVNHAAQTFTWDYPLPLNAQHKRRLLTDFVKHLYENALARHFPPFDVLAHTIELLNRSYQGDFSEGFAAALLDMDGDSRNKQKIVLQRVAEIIKQRHRRNHINAVFLSYINVNKH